MQKFLYCYYMLQFIQNGKLKYVNPHKCCNEIMSIEPIEDGINSVIYLICLNCHKKYSMVNISKYLNSDTGLIPLNKFLIEDNDYIYISDNIDTDTLYFIYHYHYLCL